MLHTIHILPSSSRPRRTAHSPQVCGCCTVDGRRTMVHQSTPRKTRTRRCLLLAAVWCYLVVNLKVALDVSPCQQPIHHSHYDVTPDLAVGLPTNDAVRPSLSLPWTDMNLQLTVNATCTGAHNKCFYPSVSSPSVGYNLIAGETAYASMYWETRMAGRLQDEFGSKHFTPDFPYQVNLTNDLAQDLKNQVAVQPTESASNASTPVFPGGGIHRNTSRQQKKPAINGSHSFVAYFLCRLLPLSLPAVASCRCFLPLRAGGACCRCGGCGG
jgi:hypothetical protein